MEIPKNRLCEDCGKQEYVQISINAKGSSVKYCADCAKKLLLP